VVALLGASAASPELPETAELVRVGSGYEAAAELLVGPAAALVVDLGRITAPHVRLLELAGKLAVPIVGFGTISAPLSGSALRSVQLVGPEKVAQALEEIFGSAGRYEPARPAEPAQPPGKRAARKVAEPEPPPAEQPRAEAEPEKTAPPAPPAPRRGLTQAELDALLEDTP